MASEYDIIIIGGGPAGLSAATSIVRQDHKTVLFDSGKYRNEKSKNMHTVPSWDHRDPREFRDKARADLDRYGSVQTVDTEVETIKQREDGLFEAIADGKTYVAKKVILATGAEDILPDIPGYTECWVSGIFHCLYCQGWEERGVPSSGLLAQGDVSNVLVALHFARQGLRLSNYVTIYTNGNEKLADELTEALKAAPAPISVDSRTISNLVKAPERAQVTLQFTDGTSKTEGFLAHKPSHNLRGDLAQQLGLDLTPMGTIAISPPFNQTSLKGVFAAGDCASPMPVVIFALSSGAAAGVGAPLQIQAETYGQKCVF